MFDPSWVGIRVEYLAYYDIGETHVYGHDDDDRDIRDKEEYGSTIKEGDYEEFFQKAMKKFGIKSPDELKNDESVW